MKLPNILFTDEKNKFFVGLLNALWISIVIWSFIILLTMLVCGGCKTTTYDARTKQSVVDPRVTVHYDKKGNVKGTSKQSPVDPRVTIYRKKR